jgi:invasion protein IalB
VGLATAAAADESFRDWRLARAADEGDCLLVQSVLSRGSGTMLAQAVVQRQNGSAVLAVRVPTGAALADGIGYRVAGGEVVALQWVSCDPDLCLAVRTLSEDELGILLRGREMVLGFRPLSGSSPLHLPVSLMGLTAGWRALGRCGEDAS